MAQMKCSRAVILILLATIGAIAAEIDALAEDRITRSCQLDGYVVAAENDEAVLCVNPENAEMAIRLKRTGDTWYSNPPDRDTNERVARGTSKDKLGAQVSLSYFVPGDIQEYMDSYTSSVQYGQFEITWLADGFRVDYVLGKVWNDEDCLPVLMQQDRFESLILDRISDKSQRDLFLKNYTLISLEKISDPDFRRPSIYGIDDLGTVFGDYTIVSPGKDLTEKEARELTEGLLNHIVNNRRDYRSKADVKSDDVVHLRHNPTYMLNPRVARFALNSMISAVADIGFDGHDVAIDNTANHLDVPMPNLKVFKVSLEYRLDGRDLVVAVPRGRITYPLDVADADGNILTYPLHTVNVLEYFGAAGQLETGYILVPDGSGSLIYLNNGKLTSPVYRQSLYGVDLSISEPAESIHFVEQALLPVFGMKAGDQAFLAIIERGDSVATITADVAGRQCSYNTVYASFTLMPYSKLEVKGRADGVEVAKTSINQYQSRLIDDDLVIRFRFLDGDRADYAGMAMEYRRYLEDRYGMRQLIDGSGMPLFLGLIGAIAKEKPVLGVPREVTVPLTTYAQAQQMVDQLIDAGVNQITMEYLGWLDGGIRHGYPNGVNHESKLGNKADFVRLATYLRDRGVRLYPNVDFLHGVKSGLFGAFVAWRDASRSLNRKTAWVSDHHMATGVSETGDSYVISPKAIPRLVSSFLKEYVSYEIAGISVDRMGMEVNSDFRENPRGLVDRQQSMAVMMAQFERLKEEVGGVMASGANWYALPFVDRIANVPEEDSRFPLTDVRVPFYQMVVHGMIYYSGRPVNLSGDARRTLLRCIETGSCPYFIVSYAEPSEVKHTEFDRFYATGYSDWLDDMVYFYEVTNAVLGDVADQPMVEHDRLDHDVYRTTYANGKQVWVNYSNQDVTVEGIEVPRMGFTVTYERQSEV